MKPTPIEFSEWRPDVATLDTKFASEVENVFAGVNSYLPFPSLLPYSLTALPGRACGLYSARTATGGWKIYAGTTTKLYTWSLAGWVDVSRTVGGAYNVPPTELWSFEQSGSHVVAVNINDVPQYIDVDAGANFVVLPGSPPRAGHVRQIGDFLFLSRLDNSGGFNNRCIIWSAINDITGWTIGLNLCDMQEFPDGGPVQGVMGAEIGYVVQDRTIRTMQFLPGDTTFIFNFSRALHDRGSISKFGFNSIGNVLYFVAEDGFYSASGQQVTPIGADKVNEWFLANSDVNRRDVVHCIAGVNKPRVVWVFHASSASPTYDKQIIFDWSNGRWAKASVPAQVWGLLATTGPAYIGYGLIGFLFVVLWIPAQVGWFSAILVLAPLFVARWAFAQYGDELQAHERTLRALVTAVETKEPHNAGHSERVSYYASMLGAAAGVSPEERDVLHYGGLFHDIGKIAIRDDVLLKPGKLTPAERLEIQRHPVAGRDLLKNMRTLETAMPIVYHHHERYDGSGYPEGLKGDSIPLLARVASIADVYDALTTKRPYRDAMTRAEALELMANERNKGWHDPGLFDLFLGVIESRPEGFLPGGEEA